MTVETKRETYDGERAYAQDLAERLNDGWRVHTQTVSEHRGGWRVFWLGLFTFGGLVLSKNRKYHVIYVREVEGAPSTVEDEAGIG
jgi:hypothetical protein